jgi:hypothetical protein
MRFNLTYVLLEHEKVHEMLDELVDKPPVVPLPQDNNGYGTLYTPAKIIFFNVFSVRFI